MKEVDKPKSARGLSLLCRSSNPGLPFGGGTWGLSPEQEFNGKFIDEMLAEMRALKGTLLPTDAQVNNEDATRLVLYCDSWKAS